jgi:hypothetical protein
MSNAELLDFGWRRLFSIQDAEIAKVIIREDVVVWSFIIRCGQEGCLIIFPSSVTQWMLRAYGRKLFQP